MEDPTLQAKSNANNTNKKNMDGSTPEINKLALSVGEGDKIWGTGQDEVLNYQRKEEWLQKQLDFYTSRLNDLNKGPIINNTNANGQEMQIDNEAQYSLPITHDTTDDEYKWAKAEEELLQKTADLHDNLYALSSRNLQNHLLIRRLTEQPVALKVLYETNAADAKEVQLKELMLTRDDKATRALALNEELKALQTERFDLDKSVLDMKKSLRTKWSELRDKQQLFKDKFKAHLPDQKDDPNAILKLEREVAFLAQQNKMVRNVFQALILVAGVDWAEDPELREIFLNLSVEPELEAQVEALPFQ